MRRKIIAGNWKMNGSTALAGQLVGQIRAGVANLDNGVEAVIIPPALYVRDVIGQAQGKLAVGVQNISQWESGAYTGEISALMAADLGCTYALVGHSERRHYFGETDAVAAEKVARGLAAGLNVVLCVGETQAERESGQAQAVVTAQVKAGLARVAAGQWSQVIVAYEPVWAIGTGQTASAADAQAMHESIRQALADMGAPANEVSVLYGGSVKADNAAALFAQPDIDGGLIGGASLIAEDFVSICRAMPADAKG